MTTERDTQRKKLYDAENAAFPGHTTNNTIGSIAQTQVYVDRVLDAHWFQSRWGKVTIEVRQKTNGRATGHRYHRSAGHICMPPWSRNAPTVLHEIAHVLTPNRYASHGPEFASVMLALVTHAIGAEAGAVLREQYRVHHVRHRGGSHAVPAPGSHPVVTKAARDALRRAEAARPVRHADIAEAAQVLRRMIAAGYFGGGGTKPREHANAVARQMEKLGTGAVAARRPPLNRVQVLVDHRARERGASVTGRRP